MLNLLRKNTKAIFIIILLVIIPPFCFFGLDVVFRSLYGQGMAGKLYGKPVSVDRFNLYQQETRNQMTAQLVLFFGIQNVEQLSSLRTQMNQFFSRPNLAQLTWERILLSRLIDQYAIPGSDGELAAWIARFPLFQTNGQFDPQRYETVLRNAFGVSTIEFEKELRTTLRIDRLRRLVSDRVHVSVEDKKEAFAQANEKAETLFVLFDGRDFTKNIQVADAEIRAFYDAHPENFRVPDKIRVRYFLLKNEEVAKSIKVSDEEIESFYEANKARFTDQETKKEKGLKEVKEEIRQGLTQRKAEETLFDKATDLSLALLKSADAAAAAKEFGATAEETALFSKEEKVLPEPVVEKLLKVDVGEYAPPIPTPTGVYIAGPLEKQPSRVPKFEECRGKVEAAVRLEKGIEKGREAARQKRQEFQRLMSQEKMSFSDAAKKLGLVLQKPAPFSRQDKVSSAVVPPAMQQLAFTLATKELSDVIPTDSGAMLFVVEERKVPEFKEDPALVEKIKAEKKGQLYQAWLSSLKRQANLVDLSPFIK